jgi:nucleotide-binding universal stress UspA family protein
MIGAKHRLEFRTIVIAADLAHSGSSALAYARRIAQIHGSQIVIVHTIDPAGYAFPDGMPKFARLDRKARAVLKTIEQDLRNEGIPVHSAVETSAIYDLILQAAHDHHADLLVLGTRAAKVIGRAALGTVARHLLAVAPCPILTVPPTANANLGWGGRWEIVLAGTDFSPASLAALDYAQFLAGSQLFVVHATSDSVGQDHLRHLERLRFFAPFNESHTVPVEHIVTVGEAGALVAEHANRLHADLVVLGSPENELKGKDLAPGTIMQVISNVNCPVLCVPARFRAAAVKSVCELACAG